MEIELRQKFQYSSVNDLVVFIGSKTGATEFLLFVSIYYRELLTRTTSKNINLPV